METEVITITDVSEADKIKKAANVLKNGGLVAFPTETVYGLGADATDSDAAKKIYAAKGRPSDNPLIIHISDPEDAERYAYTNECYYSLAKAFMPGPLTVILPKKDTVPSSVTGGLDSVAVRCPAHPIANAIIRESGVAIAAPSANISGSPSPTCAEHVVNDMTGRIDMIVDGGVSEIGLESTIIKLDGSKAILLRPGAVTCDALSCVCESVEISHAVTEEISANEKPLSPGMKYRHYAPKAQLILLDGTTDSWIKAIKDSQCEGLAIIAYNELLPDLKRAIPNAFYYSFGDECDENLHANLLFEILRDADKKDFKLIYAPLPKKSGISLALYNRMIRAAAHKIIRL